MPDPRGHRWTICGHEATAGNVRDVLEAEEWLRMYSEYGNRLACLARLRARKLDGIAKEEMHAFADGLEDLCHDTLDSGARAIRDEMERLPDEIAEA